MTLGCWMVEPEVAKLAPVVKLDPTELKYALRNGNPRLSAANRILQLIKEINILAIENM